MDNDVLRSMFENNPHITSREIAEEFGIHHTTVGEITLNILEESGPELTKNGREHDRQVAKAAKLFVKIDTNLALSPISPSNHQVPLNHHYIVKDNVACEYYNFNAN
ncbi:hypothetical protein TNCV_2198031 [Trichonephila clavipes]|nr:hypothetical protein TNCV_2198031 [Trichonephila clavipes]